MLKKTIERLIPVFDQFLEHPDEKIQNLAAEINAHLKKLPSIN